MSRNRQNHICLMLNDEEAALLADKSSACGMTQSQYLRYLITGVQPKVIPSVNDDTHIQLIRVGNNLNQIARRLNSGDQVTRFEVSEALTELKQTIGDLRKEITEERI